MSKRKVCHVCRGSGHDKAGRPVVKFVDAVDASGKPHKKHVTVHKGCGCFKCLGVGYVLK